MKKPPSPGAFSWACPLHFCSSSSDLKCETVSADGFDAPLPWREFDDTKGLCGVASWALHRNDRGERVLFHHLPATADKAWVQHVLLSWDQGTSYCFHTEELTGPPQEVQVRMSRKLSGRSSGWRLEGPESRPAAFCRSSACSLHGPMPEPDPADRTALSALRLSAKVPLVRRCRFLY